jgi:hypothetical protein
MAQIILLLAVALTWYLANRQKQHPKFQGSCAPLSDEQLKLFRTTYPKIAAKPDDLTLGPDRMLWRVNSDKTRYAFKDWSLDGETGEFHRITGKSFGFYKIERHGSKQRGDDLVNSGSMIRVATYLVFGFSLIGSFFCDKFIFFSDIDGGLKILSLAVILPINIVLVLSYSVMATVSRAGGWKFYFLGPEPLPLEPQGYGEEVGAGLGRQMGAAPARPYNPMD